VLFDLDGTLVDSAPDIAFALGTVMAKDGMAPHGVGVVRGLIGEGIHRLVEKAYALQHRSLNHDELNGRTASFAEHYKANIARETKPYPDVSAGLFALRKRGIKTAVVSNKAHALTEHLLRELHMFDRLDVVLGADDAIPKKPAPDMLKLAMGKLNVCAGETVLVGDSIADVKAAAAAELPCILIDGGYTMEPAARLGAWKTLSDFGELVALFSARGV
jgi:phosphoglycolate phosphatase